MINGNIGICGAHRTGKTTLGESLANYLGIPFVSIGTSAIFAKHGINPAKPMDFRTRLSIQWEVFTHAVGTWGDMTEPFICDRTPIDMMAYTLAEVAGDTLDNRTEKELQNYLDLCRLANEKNFSHLIVVPPAIPIVDAIGKASPSRGYIEHVHVLCLGLYSQTSINGYVIPQGVTDLNDRVSNVASFLECR
jgi:hypothetical protein